MEKNICLNYESDIKNIELDFVFSPPEIVPYEDYVIKSIKESDLNKINPGLPVLPVNLTSLELSFGTKIINVEYEHSPPIIFNLTKKIAFGSAHSYDNLGLHNTINDIKNEIYEDNDQYPSDWIFYHTGGGLSYGIHKTFFVLRIYPVIYFPNKDQIQFIQQIKLNISYLEPEDPILEKNNIFDLLIISPKEFFNLSF